ncbi:hypothetical protein [Bombilactobacillus apium]|uniref:hypothetical protein n=1 Tax=Bombilactobacillus apium TaxID=2675299 RepID=UPI001E328B4D|nr:hypothetical protein [Bombilactobacillus apium]
MAYTAFSLLFLVIMLATPSLLTARLGLSVLTKYFPVGRGKITSYYSLMTALTYFLGPLVSVLESGVLLWRHRKFTV